MTTWIVGDVHGCAAELAELVSTIGIGATDELVCVGDLFHRGPDALGVMELLRELGARFVLGNHERRVLARHGLAPRRWDGSDRPRVDTDLGDLAGRYADALRGDGGAPCPVPAERRGELIEFLLGHSGYCLARRAVEAPGTPGPDWLVVHAGLLPGVPLEHTPIEALTRLRHLRGRRASWWYEDWEGPELVLFGHSPSPYPRAWRVRGRLVALGLDTGCVYGGSLSAYAPALDELVSVPASRAYAVPGGRR